MRFWQIRNFKNLNLFRKFAIHIYTMPKILIYKNIWIFVFYPTDKYENKMHVHVGRKSTTNLCKIWIDTNVEVADEGDFKKAELNEILEISKKYQSEFQKMWKDFMAGKEINTIKVK